MLERNAAITIGTGGLISNGISSVTIGGSSANHTYGAESTIAGGMSNEAKAWGAAIGGGHSNNANTVNATTVNGDTITAGDTVTINSNGIDMGGTKITNLKDGDINANSTDAVTGKQLFNTNRSIEKLGNRVDKVGAGAAALAALHPLDFDPDAKWDFAAGYGNYSGENAVALGAYYRPNEDLMFSIGSTMGNGENMLNGFAGTNANVDTTKLFPDVPINHWAYEAVAAMSRSGLVEGYPKSYKPIMTSSRY